VCGIRTDQFLSTSPEFLGTLCLTLVKIFAGSLRIFKDLQRPIPIFKDLQRSFKDQRQGSLKVLKDFMRIFSRSQGEILAKIFSRPGSLRI